MDNDERREQYRAWLSGIVNDKTLSVSQKLKLINSSWGMDGRKTLASLVTAADYLKMLDDAGELVEANPATMTETINHLLNSARQANVLFELMVNTLDKLADTSAD